MEARPLSEAFRVAQGGDSRNSDHSGKRSLPPNSACAGGRFPGTREARGCARSPGQRHHRERRNCFFPPARLPKPMARWSAAKGVRKDFFPVFAQQADVRRAGDGWATQHGRRWMTCLRPWRRRFRNWLPLSDAAPSSKFRMAGAKIPREPHRYSGRTSITANISVVEPKPPDDPDSALSFSMEGPRPAAFRAAAFLLVARMEFHPGGEQVSERDRR